MTTSNPHIDMDANNSDARLRAAVESALSSGYEVIARTSSTIIVKKCLDIIERYRDDGLTFAQIAEFISEKVAPVTEIALKKAYGREIKARSARANAPPTSVSVPSAVAATPTAPTPKAEAKKRDVSAPSAPAPSSPFVLSEIPPGERTHTACENIAVTHFARRYGGRNPAQVKVDEVSTAELDWLEKLWDLNAPANPGTGDLYRIKSFTPAGRPIYDKPFFPPGAFRMESGGFIEGVDDDLHADMKKYGAGLAEDQDDNDMLQAIFADGYRSVPFPKRNVNGMLRGMMPDIRKAAEKAKGAAAL
ncbi:hypothetical protein [Thiomonas sp.]